MRIYYSDTIAPGYEFPEIEKQLRWFAGLTIEDSGEITGLKLSCEETTPAWIYAIAEDFGEKEDFYRIVHCWGNTYLSAEHGYYSEDFGGGYGVFKYAVADSPEMVLFVLAEGMMSEGVEGVRVRLESQFKDIPW